MFIVFCTTVFHYASTSCILLACTGIAGNPFVKTFNKASLRKQSVVEERTLSIRGHASRRSSRFSFLVSTMQITSHPFSVVHSTTWSDPPPPLVDKDSHFLPFYVCCMKYLSEKISSAQRLAVLQPLLQYLTRQMQDLCLLESHAYKVL